MITLNGTQISDFEGKTAEELIISKGYRTNLIAVEYNGEILPKDKYSQTILKENDSIEVVSFVGGG